MAGLNSSITDIVGGSTTRNDLTAQITGIANILIGLIAAVSIFYIIKGSWEWIQGNDKNQAQTTILQATVGLVVSILAFVIIRWFVGGAKFLNDVL